ncbi:MAG: hypothetical protein JST95_05290, partial [Bacteroidetes bacterium]|nr:hypothetical protein [Bacteroidota bacterium]
MKTKNLLWLGILLFPFIFFWNEANAQVLFTTTSSGGAGGGGSIAKYDASTQLLSAAHNFELEGTSPAYSKLIQANDGKLYGMTYGGGINNAGVIFSYDPGTSTYSKLKDFS